VDNLIYSYQIVGFKLRIFFNARLFGDFFRIGMNFSWLPLKAKLESWYPMHVRHGFKISRLHLEIRC